MIVLCNGMPRSASTWSFNIVVGLLRRSDSDAQIATGYAEDLATFLRSIPEGTRHIVVKCHTLDDLGRALVTSDACKVVYTWRDIADAVASSMVMFDYGFEHALSLITQSLELYRFHRNQDRAVVLKYAEIMQRPINSVARIAAYLGLNLKEHDLKEVADDVSFENTRRRLTHATNQRDPATLLFPAHIRNGGSGYGLDIMTPDQQRRIHTLMAQFGMLPQT